MTLAEILSLLRDPKPHGGGHMAFCPAHDDGATSGRRSLSVTEKDGKILLHCFAGCRSEDIVKELGLTMGDLFSEEKPGRKKEIVAKYDYLDAAGALVFQVVRQEPGDHGASKTFKQRRPDGRGCWIWDMKGISPFPYRLPELLAALERGETVFVAEGEKDADRLATLGLVATANHGGAGKWTKVHSEYFPAGAEVVVLPDNDDPGREHARKAAGQLTARGCRVRVLELPGLPPKGDLSDWLNAGGTKEELLRLAAATREWRPDPEQEWPDPEEIREELRPVEPLPPAIIPEPLRPWLADVARRMQCPLDFVAVGALVVAGAIVGAGCGIRPKAHDDWLVVPNLWGGIIARPSMLKTPSLAEIMKPLARLEIEAKDQFESEQRYFGAEIEAHKAQKEALKAEMHAVAKGKRDAPKVTMDALKRQLAVLEEPDPPVRRRFRTNDSTIEKLGELLNENPRGILVFRDELVGLLCSWDREDRKQDRAFYLEAWNGYGSFTTDRIGRGTVDVSNCCVSIMGGVQPSKLMAYLHQASSDVANDGMIQRFQLLVYPDEPTKWKYIDQYPSAEAKAQAYVVLKALAEMDFTQCGAEFPEGEKIPFYHFDSEAQEIFKTWLIELQEKIQAESTPIITEHLSKYRSLMPSLALIFHLIGIAKDQPAGPVTRLAAEQAAAWCDYLESHARRIYGLLADASITAAAELSRKILKKELKDGFTVRDIYRNCWHLLNTKERAQDACDELVAAGWLRLVYEDVPGRHPKEIFLINPKIFPQKPGVVTDITDVTPKNMELMGANRGQCQ